MVRRPGRPNGGVAHVEHLDGEVMAKQRLVAILKTFIGDLTVAEACEELGISYARFQQLRERMLQASLDALHPGRPGRPRKLREGLTEAEAAELRRMIHQLERELELARAQAELVTRLGAAEARRQGKLATHARSRSAARKSSRR